MIAPTVQKSRAVLRDGMNLDHIRNNKMVRGIPQASTKRCPSGRRVASAPVNMSDVR